MKRWFFYPAEKDQIYLGGRYARILSIIKVDLDTFVVQEECDKWFNKTYTKAELLDVIEELKNWINDKAT